MILATGSSQPGLQSQKFTVPLAPPSPISHSNSTEDFASPRSGEVLGWADNQAAAARHLTDTLVVDPRPVPSFVRNPSASGSAKARAALVTQTQTPPISPYKKTRQPSGLPFGDGSAPPGVYVSKEQHYGSSKPSEIAVFT